MGREKDPFYGREHSQDRRRREHPEEYDMYEDDLDFDEEDEYDIEEMQDFDDRGSNIPRRRSAPPLPPFPSSTRNRYPRTSRTSHMPESTTPRPRMRPTQTPRPRRQTYLPDEPQPHSRRSTGSHQHPSQQRSRTRSDIPTPPPLPPSSPRRVSSRPRKRSVWPIFLIGCVAGAVSLVAAVAIVVLILFHSVQNSVLHPGGTSKGIQQQPNTQTIPLSALSQLIVCDSAGNISLSVDPNPNATNTTITTTKIAHTDDQNAANQTFNQISVSVQAQPTSQTLTCDTLQANSTSTANTTPTTTSIATNNTVLSVNVILPLNQTDQMATVDVAIALPKSVVQLQQDPTPTLISMPNAQGTINITGISGEMKIQNSSGDITVMNGIIVDGSKLQAQGKLTFNGWISANTAPQNNTGHASLAFSGAYLVDLTLPETSSVMINATVNTRAGKITSDFSLSQATNSDGSHTSYGPFNPATPTNENTAPRLTLQSSSGNIAIHKVQTVQSTPSIGAH